MQSMHNSTEAFESFLSSAELVSESRFTKIYSAIYEGHHVCIKKTHANYRREDIQDATAGLVAFNALESQTPNFVFTYCSSHGKSIGDVSYVMTDYVDGILFEKLLMDPSFSLHDMFSLFTHLSLILDHCQNIRGIIHTDLYPWNIIIKVGSFEHSYVLCDGRKVKIKHKYLPVIVDYGKSVFLCAGWFHQNISPFSISRIRDIMTVMMSSLGIYLKYHCILETQIKEVISIMNFWVKHGIWKSNPFHSLVHVKNFLRQNKNYSNMLFLSSNDMGISSLDVFYFMMNTFPHVTEHVEVYTDKIYIQDPPRDLFLCCPLVFPLQKCSRTTHLDKIVVKKDHIDLEYVYKILEWYPRSSRIDKHDILLHACSYLYVCINKFIEAPSVHLNTPFQLNTHSCIHADFPVNVDTNILKNSILVFQILDVFETWGVRHHIPPIHRASLLWNSTSNSFWKTISKLIRQ
ncbi:MAG: hypothetical protein EBV19_07195 [Flavobacteriia bacterium]|nr:hypothetical protein [Flavobacteriia bacterium]